MRWPFKILGLLIVAAFIAPIIKTCSEPSAKTTAVDSAPYYNEEFEAKSAAERAVQDRLLSPSTAKFISQAAAKNKKGEWEVVGSLDANNTYGVPIRYQYLCAFKREGDAMRLTRMSFPL